MLVVVVVVVKYFTAPEDDLKVEVVVMKMCLFLE
jgi:hypothetical protein